VVQIPNFIEIPAQAERSAGRYLLFLGRIHWKKGLENLITAISMTDEFLASDLVLKIAGKGSPAYEAELKDLVTELNLSDKIVFVGQVEGEDKQKLLADAFWTIMPSHTENFGLVVLESLAQNTPVIASKGSPWEILEKERLGFWTENSPEELSQILKTITRMDEQEYQSYRRKGRDFVKQNFDISENIDKWTKVYQDLR
jgi:glycosyltransferase involved in cell wall biosynthesis